MRAYFTLLQFLKKSNKYSSFTFITIYKYMLLNRFFTFNKATDLQEENTEFKTWGILLRKIYGLRPRKQSVGQGFLKRCILAHSSE